MLVTWPFVMLLLDYWPLGRMQNAECRMKLDATNTSILRSPSSAAVRRGVDSTAAGGRATQHASQRTAQSRIANRQSQILFPLLVEKIPFFILAALGSVVTMVVQRRAMTAVESLPLDARAGNALISYGRYLGKLFWPTELAVYYPHPGHWALGLVMLAGGAIVVISVLVWVQRRRHPCLLVGWLWFVGTLVPVIGLVQVGAQAMADRYTYIPSIGVMVLAVWGAYELTRGWRFQVLALSLTGGVAVLFCLVLARQQAGYWKESETLFRHALAVTKDNWLAHINLGIALHQKGQLDAALSQLPGGRSSET